MRSPFGYPGQFWIFVEPGVGDDDCWLWRGSKNHKGYGQFRDSKAHRFAYELEIGPIPEGLALDHLCRVRHCVNPAHLEPVTLIENNRRGVLGGFTATHCRHGHEWALFAYFNSNRGDRVCRACERARYWNRMAALVPERECHVS